MIFLLFLPYGLFYMGMTPEETFTKVNPYFLKGITNCSQISRESGVSIRTVNRYFKKFKSGIPLDKLQPRGKHLTFPKKLNTKIAKMMKKNKLSSSKMIANSLKESADVIISRRTINRRLNLMGYKRVRPVAGLRLNKSHIKKRNLFFKNYIKKIVKMLILVMNRPSNLANAGLWSRLKISRMQSSQKTDILKK